MSETFLLSLWRSKTFLLAKLSSAVVPQNVNGGVRQNGNVKNVTVLSLFTCECPQSLFLEEKKISVYSSTCVRWDKLWLMLKTRVILFVLTF